MFRAAGRRFGPILELASEPSVLPAKAGAPPSPPLSTLRLAYGLPQHATLPAVDTTEGGAAPNGPKPHLGLRATSLLGKVSVLGDMGEGWGRKAYYPKQTVGQTYLTLDRVEPSRRPIKIGGGRALVRIGWG